MFATIFYFIVFFFYGQGDLEAVAWSVVCGGIGPPFIHTIALVSQYFKGNYLSFLNSVPRCLSAEMMDWCIRPGSRSPGELGPLHTESSMS